MICKKNTGDRCLCLKRKHDGCAGCEKAVHKILWDHKWLSVEEFREKYKDNPTLMRRLEKGIQLFAERHGKV